MKVIVTGATGFIGKQVIIELAKAGHEVTAVSRRALATSGLPCNHIVWDPEVNSASELTTQIINFDSIIHLAGEPIATSRWTKTKKNRIYSSRIESTKKTVAAIKTLPHEFRPKSFICASAVGFYGNRKNEILSESSGIGTGFLSDVVSAWEAEASKVESIGVRGVQLRIGVVLGRNGGALEMMKPVQLGDGKQWMSWIHITDLVRLIRFCLENPLAQGPINAVSQEPIENKVFTQMLAESKKQSVLPPLPGFMLKTVLGEMSHILMDSVRVIPEKAINRGFQYLYPTLKEALFQIFEGIGQNEHRFSSVQFIPKNKVELFNFFSKAENLEMITPPWLNFKILKKSTPSIQEGTLIDYRLKIHGVPIHWRTKIEEWISNERFTDTQLKGPYSKWHHTHRFEEIPGRTLMWDDVIYRLPAGNLGSLFGLPLVRKDISKIIEFRKKKILEVFN